MNLGNQYLDLSDAGIQDLKGLEDVITQEIIAGGNFFTNIDLSYNNSLTNIHIDGGDATEIILIQQFKL